MYIRRCVIEETKILPKMGLKFLFVFFTLIVYKAFGEEAFLTGKNITIPAQVCNGYGTRYWDCCKAHCGWEDNVNPATRPMQSCSINNQPLSDNEIASACTKPASDSAFMCHNTAPWAVSNDLSYGFAAVPAQGDVCGRCYQLDFDGTGHYNQQDPGSQGLRGKRMIVQATNIGYDVGGGQFDIQIPGGGVGAFDACTLQWGVQTSELGAQYGGFMTSCQQEHPGDYEGQKQCVLGRCSSVFDNHGLGQLANGCRWFVNWFQAADDPNFQYQEVACPRELVQISGIDRSSLNDIGSLGC